MKRFDPTRSLPPRLLRAYLAPRVALVPAPQFEDWLETLCETFGVTASTRDDVMEVFHACLCGPGRFSAQLASFLNDRLPAFDDLDPRICQLLHAQLAKHGDLLGMMQLIDSLERRGDWPPELNRESLARAWRRRLARHLRDRTELRQRDPGMAIEALLLLAGRASSVDRRRYLAQAGALLPQLKPGENRQLIERFESAARDSGILRVRIILSSDPLDDKLADRRWSRALEILSQPVPVQPLPDRAAGIVARLRASFPWAVEAIDALEDDLLVAEAYGNGILRLTPMLLVGPPGTGKTSLLNRFAREIGLPFAMISAAGSSSPRALTGTTKGWASACPSLPVELIARHKVANPLLLIDEIDKEARDSVNGRLSDALLSFLEPENAGRYFDECLTATVDLQWFNWAAACNDARPIPAPVRSRLREVQVGVPRPEHGPLIARAVVEDLRTQYRIPMEEEILDIESWQRLTRLFAREPSARDIALETRRQFSASLRRRVRLSERAADRPSPWVAPDHDAV